MFLGANRNFSASIGSFQRLPAGAPEVILFPQRLALKYNTTPRCPCQHFLTDFFLFLQVQNFTRFCSGSFIYSDVLFLFFYNVFIGFPV